MMESSTTQSKPFQIVFSIQSSANPIRSLNFAEQRLFLQRELQHDDVNIKSVVLKDMSLYEQVQLATETDLFITGCGGGAVTAIFLPKGATTIIYFNEQGGQRQNKPTGLPARLDWDLFNHLSYIHVLWFPSTTLNRKHDLMTLTEVVRDTIRRTRIGSSSVEEKHA